MSEAPSSDVQLDAAAKQQIILLVNGRPMRQFYISVYLQRLRYQVIMAKTVEEANQYLGLTVPRVIIADYDLPDMTGLELLKQVRQERRTRNVPFVVYTANREPGVRQACETAGCSEFVYHPAKLEELFAAVRRATQTRPRNFVRLATPLEVVVGEDRGEGRVRQDLIIAISEQGMFISTKDPIEYGSILPFTFHLPNAPGWFFRIQGQILYSHAVTDLRKLPGMAVKFLKMKDQEQELLKDFIKQELMDGIVQPETPND